MSETDLIVLPGLNVQWPWSALMLSGEKTIETRGYPLPLRYQDSPLVLIQTPGPTGRREAEITCSRQVGLVVFAKSYLYDSRSHWNRERSHHQVQSTDAHFGFSEDKPKWAWPITTIKEFADQDKLPAPNPRGIVYCSTCHIERKYLEQVKDLSPNQN